MPNTTPLAVELYQRAGDGLVPLLVRATGGDTTDIEALIAAAIKQHNEDPEAHPDIRQAIKEAGGGLVSTPVLTLPDRLPLGSPAPLKMTAAAGLNGARIVSFSVTVGDAEPVEVAATDNAATYTFTPTGNAGDTLTVGVTAVDNFGNKSKAAVKTAGLFEKAEFVIAGITKGVIQRSMNNGVTWKAPQALGINSLKDFVMASDGTIIAADYYGVILRSTDNGVTWDKGQTIGKNIYAICLAPDGTIITSGSYGVILRSRDNGITWEEAQKTETAVVSALGVAPDGTVIAAGNNGSIGTIQRSTDNGLTWQAVQSLGGPYFYINTVCAIRENIVILGGNTLNSIGYIQRSQDNGLTWEEGYTFNSGIINVNGMLIAPDGTIIASGSKGVIQRSTDNGATWKNAQTLGMTYVSALGMASDGTVIAGGILNVNTNGVIQRSTDNGVTWEAAQPIDIGGAPIAFVASPPAA